MQNENKQSPKPLVTMTLLKSLLVVTNSHRIMNIFTV